MLRVSRIWYQKTEDMVSENREKAKNHLHWHRPEHCCWQITYFLNSLKIPSLHLRSFKNYRDFKLMEMN